MGFEIIVNSRLDFLFLIGLVDVLLHAYENPTFFEYELLVIGVEPISALSRILNTKFLVRHSDLCQTKQSYIIATDITSSHIKY